MTDKNNSTVEVDLLGSLFGESIIGEHGFKSVFTPENVVKDMLDLLDDEDSWFEKPGILNKKFLDVHCKSGRFLTEILDRLLESNQFNFEFNKAIRKGDIDNNEYQASELGKREYIIENCLYAVCPDFMTSMDVSRNLTGDAFGFDNAAIAEGSAGKVPTAKQSFSALKEMLKSKGEENMTFDVVVGNPPYNDGMDIDFVFGAFEICKEYVLMITPAKWQTAEASQKIKSKYTYEQFRENLVPHMKEVVFYPDCKDVFKIMQSDGITYYAISKSNTFEKCTVINKCETIKQFNSSDYRSILNRETLINIGNTVNEYLKDAEKFKFCTDSSKRRYAVGTNAQLPGGGLYAITKSNPKVYYLGESKVIDTWMPNWSAGMSSQIKITFRSESKDECDSFCSYLNSKFVRFFIALNISKMAPVTNNDYFRFVPAPAVLNAYGNRVPGKFDHIYTDNELYKTFNLPQEYIDIIEAVIKERKA